MKKPVPLKLTCNVRLPFELLSITAAAVSTALEQDIQWIAAVVERGANAVPEWFGAMAHASRQRGDTALPHVLLLNHIS